MFKGEQMKALELLQRNLINMAIANPMESLEISGYEVNEAIAELEESMKPKTCYGCKQSWEPNNQTFHKYFCEYLKIPVHGGFYCNRYEPKEQ